MGLHEGFVSDYKTTLYTQISCPTHSPSSYRTSSGSICAHPFLKMPRPRTRTEALASLRQTLSSGKPIIGAGAGIGLSAKFVEEGGGDLIVIYNSGRYRMAGRGSLAGLMPYGNANDVVLDMAAEVLPIVKRTPVIAGICASDPFREIETLLKQIKEMGFAGIQVCMWDVG